MIHPVPQQRIEIQGGRTVFKLYTDATTSDKGNEAVDNAATETSQTQQIAFGKVQVHDKP